jgi:hypothetical protein
VSRGNHKNMGKIDLELPHNKNSIFLKKNFYFRAESEYSLPVS